MTHVFQKFLVMSALTTAFAATQANTSMAQFDASMEGEANVVLDLDTGEVTLNLGSVLTNLGVTGVEFDVDGFDASTGLGEPSQLRFDGIGFLKLSPFQVGRYNIGSILGPSVRTRTGVAGFEFTFGREGIPLVTATVANGGVTLTGIPSFGDFDTDGDVDVDDIDFYIPLLGSVSFNQEIDLNRDIFVTIDDVMLLITFLVQTSNGQTGTFLGDLNLDGSVDVLGDGFVLIGNLGSAASSYANGDINLDGTVDVLGDAFILVGNLGLSNEP